MPLYRIFAIAIVALIPSLALAEPGPLQGACRDDMKTLCGSIQPGGGRLRDCMREHRSQLSNNCKLAIADRMLERSANRQGASSTSIKSVPRSAD
jgi:Cysteine rich repeat